MTFIKTTLAAMLAVAATSATAANMTPAEEAALRQNCTGDYMRFCSMYEPNTPQVEQCFQQRMKELSPSCQAAIASYSKTNPAGRKR